MYLPYIPTNNILCLSGGKDSTAMALLAYHQHFPNLRFLAFESEWEHPQARITLDWIAERTGLPVERLTPVRGFNYYLIDHPVHRRTDPPGSPPHRHGYGWPSMPTRWCTRLKVNTLNQYARQVPYSVRWVGITADEVARWGKPDPDESTCVKWHPLALAGIEAKTTLDICNHFNAPLAQHYKHYPRLSCFCCPLASLATHRTTRRLYPELWNTILDLDSRVTQHPSAFSHGHTAADLDRIFAVADRQHLLWGQDA